MSKLDGIRNLIADHKIIAAGQKPRKFLPNGSLDDIFTSENILESLRGPSFKIGLHRLQNTVDLVLKDSKRIFAILVEERLEYALTDFIKNEISDRELPVEKVRLKAVLEESAVDKFADRQWEYSAHVFSGGPYCRKLKAEGILPYVEQTPKGGGAFSRVYDVIVHPAHQKLDSEVRGTV